MVAEKTVRSVGVAPRALKSLLDGCRALVLASASRGRPWCAPLWFARSSNGRELYFWSDPASRHARELARRSTASAALFVDAPSIRELRGAQLEGTVARLDGHAAERAQARFLSRFPSAAPFLAGAASERLFAFRITTAKVTDNRRRFGRKQRFELRGRQRK